MKETIAIFNYTETWLADRTCEVLKTMYGHKSFIIKVWHFYGFFGFANPGLD